jgi:protein-disulfide isomerase
MHDLLWDAAARRALGSYDELAKALGLAVDQFRRDMADPDLAVMIADDQAVAAQFGARGTPSFFVNGRPLVGAQPLDAFVALIDEERAAAEAFADAHGVARSKLYATMRRDWATEVAAPPLADHERRTIETADLVSTGAGNNATIEIVGCVDFDCPYSARGAAMIDQVLGAKPYAKTVRYHLAHFPLPMHKDAEAAHRAAIAAGEQGKFWEMRALLYEDRKRRGEAEFVDMANQLGLDAKRFRADLNSSATADKLSEDKQLCAGLGVSGTPTYFVNGRMMRGAVPFERVAEVLDEELAGGFEAGR